MDTWWAPTTYIVIEPETSISALAKKKFIFTYLEERETRDCSSVN